MTDMPKKLPQWVYPETKGPKHRRYTVYYFRPVHHGPRTRLKSEPFSDAWYAEYRALVTGMPIPQTPEEAKRQPAKGNLAWLIQQHKNSSDWLRLAPSTRKNRDNIFLGIIKKVGDVPYEDVDKGAVARGLELRSDRPFAAKEYLKAVRALYKWAVANDYVAHNPADGVSFSTPKTTGFPTWTDEEIARFRAYWPHGTMQRLAMEIILGTGLRRGDAVQLGRQHIRDGVLTIRLEKSQYKTQISIPILPGLMDAIEQGPCGDLTFIVGALGNRYKKESFGEAFRKACKDAGVPGRAHGLRKAAAVRFAENGATVHQLMAWFGWDSQEMAQIYTEAADRKKLAAEAGRLIQTSLPSPSVSRPHPKKTGK